MTRHSKIALVATTLAVLGLGGIAIASPKGGDCSHWGDRAASGERAAGRMMGFGPMHGDFDRNWTADDVRKVFDGMLTRHGEKRLKVGEIKPKDENVFVVDIVTLENSLVRRMEVDRHNGRMARVN